MNQEQRERVDNIMADARKMIWVTFQREGITQPHLMILD